MAQYNDINVRIKRRTHRCIEIVKSQKMLDGERLTIDDIFLRGVAAIVADSPELQDRAELQDALKESGTTSDFLLLLSDNFTARTGGEN